MSYKNNPVYIESQINAQKLIANELLTKIQNFNSSPSVCAGGAPRDWYLGKIANDLDFFVDTINAKGDVFDIEKFFQTLNVDHTELTQSGMYESNPRLRSVFEFTYKNQKCQIILIQEWDTDNEVVRAWDIHTTFPVNVSKVTYRTDYYGNFEILSTPEFRYGHEFKILDFEHEYLYNNAYKKKIRKKFKDYGLVLRKENRNVFKLEQIV